MTTLLSYLGWLIGVAAFGCVLYCLARKLSGTGQGSANAFRSLRAGGGMSEREAALVAQARADAGTRPTGRDDVVAMSPRAAPPVPVAGSETARGKVELAAPGGIMKSAGDPRVRKAFAQAMQEVETKTYDSGLWAMALVNCNGDEKMARLAYMKARAADIVWADAKATESPQRPPEPS